MRTPIARSYDTIRKAAALAEEDGKARAILIPADPHLSAIDPMTVALRFPSPQQAAIAAAVQALVNIYDAPDSGTIESAALDLLNHASKVQDEEAKLDRYITETMV